MGKLRVQDIGDDTTAVLGQLFGRLGQSIQAQHIPQGLLLPTYPQLQKGD